MKNLSIIILLTFTVLLGSCGKKTEQNNSTLSDKAFKDTLNTHKVVLVDVYADWCGPCKKMKPLIDEITKEQAGKVTVIRIDADQNPELCQNLNVEALPTLLLYKNKNLVWSNVGFMDKPEILEALNKQ